MAERAREHVSWSVRGKRRRALGDHPQQRPLRIAMLAPPWIPVPPPAYGGIEAVAALLVGALEREGHAVTLFAPPGSRAARLIAPLDAPHPEAIGRSLFEADHVAVAFAEIERRGFDLVHDHSGFAAVAMADRLAVPMVHTIHGPLDGELAPFYARHGHKVAPVAISHAQLESAAVRLDRAVVVHNPFDIDSWPFFERKEDYLLYIGRMDHVKGAHRAIAVAKRAGLPLVLAGPVQPGQEEYFRKMVAPHLDGSQIVYVGEVGGRRKVELFGCARALLMPIRWQEPFGMVMVEALASGTPVVAFPEGAAPEIVVDGVNGFLVADEAQMAQALFGLGRIDPRRCRESVARFAPREIARRYIRLYLEVTAQARRREGVTLPRRGVLPASG